MKTAELGQTGMEITRVGLGAWAIGGGGVEWGWGAQDDDQSVATIHHALDLGVNWIDTAPHYGFGHSETVVGRALRELGSRPRPFVFTKAGQLEGPGGTTVRVLRRDSVRRECEASLERLGVDAIDLYQIHFPVEDAAETDEGWGEFARLKDEGLVRHIGVSNFSVSQLERAQAIAPVETLQPQYSLIERDVERDVLPYCEEHGVGVIVYSPMGSGMLSGTMTRERVESLASDDWRRRSSRFQEPELSENLALVERLRVVAERHGVSVGAVAVAWTLRHPAVDGAIVGFRRPDQVEPIVVAAELELSDEDVAGIEVPELQ